MKIALCLFGYPKGSTIYAEGAYQQKFKHLFENVMIHSPDVFIHCWDKSLEHELVTLFKPKKYIFQDQIGFETATAQLNLDRFRGSRGDILKTLSFFYTRQMSNKLKKMQEEEIGNKYDCVVSSRFDVGYHNYRKNKTSYIKFDPTLDLSCVYSAYWDQINAGISDHWFYSNSETMDKIANINDCVIDYLKKDSEYCRTMATGWLDSNSEKEFSNEFLKEGRVENLKKYPDHYCLNNHCLYKWHFYVNSLWTKDKCRFLNEGLWR